MKADGFLVKDVNMDAYMEVRRLTQEFIDDFLGYWILPANSQMSSLLVGCGLPGGMMGSMMADLRNFQGAINAAQRAHGRPEMTLENIALMNLFNMLNDKPRWSSIDKDAWGMILGKMGKLPGELDPEIVALAKEKGMEFYTGNPQDMYPNELPKFRQMMKEEGWDCGEDDEELLNMAMFERQYRDYRSGIAKERFNKDLADLKAKANAPIVVTRPVVEMPKFSVDEYVAKYPKAWRCPSSPSTSTWPSIRRPPRCRFPSRASSCGRWMWTTPPPPRPWERL